MLDKHKKLFLRTEKLAKKLSIKYDIDTAAKWSKCIQEVKIILKEYHSH